MKKIMAILLSFVLLFALVGCKEGKNNQSGNSVQEINFEAQYIRTNGYNSEVKYPFSCVISSIEELTDYYNKYKNMYDLERKKEVYPSSTIGFLDASDKYVSSFFNNKVLVLVVLEEGSGSIRHKVNSVKAGATEILIDIECISPQWGTDDMAEWHIFIELEKEKVSAEQSIKITYDGVPKQVNAPPKPKYIVSVTFADGKTFTSDTLTEQFRALRGILRNLDYIEYNPDAFSPPEYTVYIEDDDTYGINLSKGYSRSSRGQIYLDKYQKETIKEILEWANAQCNS